ncbi:MAG: D-Ala-D-Ala carboxypeptidase family metallohydrolase [Candidatus Omnitrophica bacterium]|nr:D-Ala-D-Ala carboxypeptidase family metallohydrolase [Candidatus Omnitrophota bacterium]
MPQWKHFTVNEVLNPYFDDNPAKNSWDEMPEIIQSRLEKTMNLVDAIREEYGRPLQLNSTYRLHDRNGRAHREGHAVDFQPVEAGLNYGFRIIEIIENCLENTNIFYNIIVDHVRVFWEWKKQGSAGWIHLDTNYNPNNSSKFIEYLVGYPDKSGNMVYAPFEDKAPWEYVK